MKVLLLNGSHHQNGNTALALEEAAKALEAEGVETELFQIGAGAIQDCIDCRKCTEKDVSSQVIRSMPSLQKQRKPTGLSLARPSTMPILRGASCPSWTVSFMPQAVSFA